MGEEIKSAIEIAMEKLKQIEDLSEEEKEKIKIKKKLSPLMADFYGSKLDADRLWNELKKEPLSMVLEAQKNITDSIRFGIAADEIKKRKDAILALETLKKSSKSSFIDQSLGYLENLQKKSTVEKENVFNNLRSNLENNPENLLKEINQGGRKMVVQLSVEEAINQNPQWQKFVSDIHQRYEQEFKRVLDSIKAELE
jgi:hypothetical protein